MKKLLLAVALISTPVFALQVVSKDDVLVRRDDGVAIVMTQEELATALQEAQNNLHNQQVLAQRAEEAQMEAIEGIRSVITPDPIVNAEVAVVDTAIYN